MSIILCVNHIIFYVISTVYILIITIVDHPQIVFSEIHIIDGLFPILPSSISI